MRRRGFIKALAGSVAAWPLAAQAQQPERLRRIGVFTMYMENDSEAQRRVGAFRKRLQELGWTDGVNTQIDYRWTAADPEHIDPYAAEFAHLKPDVVLAAGEQPAFALHREAPGIPIVFVQVDDPVGAGFIKSLTHPGGNLTGFTPVEFSMGAKMLEILKQVAPSIGRAAIIRNPDSVTHTGEQRAIEAAAAALGVQVTAVGVRNAPEIEHAIDEFASNSSGGLIVLSYALANVHRKVIISRAAQYRLPTIYPFPHYVVDGGLISYGVDPADEFRDAASYVDRILRGEKAGDLPVQQPVKFELVINVKTAKALGLTVPSSLLATADQVIE